MNRSRLTTAFIVLTCIATYGAAVWFLWHPLFAFVQAGGSFSDSVKDYYLGDQLSYLSIARNVQEGRPAYVEPMTATGSSIYPSGYYWLLGIVANVTGTNPFFAWNIAGILAGISLMAGIGLFGKWASRSNWGLALGAIPIVTGTLQGLEDSPRWKDSFGVHAELWSPFAILFSPNAEAAALVVCMFALLVLATALSKGQVDLRRYVLAGALTGLTMNLHTYVALFTITVVVLAVLFHHLVPAFSRRALLITMICLTVTWIPVCLGVTHTPLGLWAIVLAGFALPVALDGEWRRTSGKPLLIGGIALVLAALPLVGRIAIQAADKDSFFYLRQGFAHVEDLTLPAGQMLLQTLPVLALAALAITYTVRHRHDSVDATWLSLLAAVLIGGVIMLENRAWNMNQEPYRFFPYTMLFATALSVPVILRGRPTVAGAGRMALVLALIAVTLPTARIFYRDNAKVVMTVNPLEQAAYHDITAAIPKKGLVLLDSCIPKRQFKVMTTARVADFNLGMAIPSAYKAIDAVLYGQHNGVLANDTELRRAGITSFTTMDICNGPDDQQLRDRFGDPIATIPLFNPASCGLPPGTHYSVYKVPDREGDTRTTVAGYNDQKRFDPIETTKTARDCGLLAPPI